MNVAIEKAYESARKLALEFTEETHDEYGTLKIIESDLREILTELVQSTEARVIEAVEDGEKRVRAALRWAHETTQSEVGLETGETKGDVWERFDKEFGALTDEQIDFLAWRKLKEQTRRPTLRGVDVNGHR